MATSASTGVWTCPGCERRVPRREPRCHCGAARLELTADPQATGSGVPSPALVAVVLVAVAVALLALLGRGGSAGAPEAARSSGAGRGAAAPAASRPAVFPPLPELPPDPE